MKHRLTMAILAGTALAVLGGCASNSGAAGQDGDPGTWELTDADSVTPATTVLSLEVTRIACASGVTGKVLAPKVSYEQSRILIEADVEPHSAKSATCQANNYVSVRLELSEPIGDRDLVDGSCVNGDGAHTIFCDDPVRWRSR